MQYIDAVGIHGFPGAAEGAWQGWTEMVRHVQQTSTQHRSGAEIWISATGYSTWRHDEYEQLKNFAGALEAPVERLYWQATRDLNPEFPPRDGFHADDRDYHFGLYRSDGTPKLLARLWAERGWTEPGTRLSPIPGHAPAPPAISRWSLPAARALSAPISRIACCATANGC